MNSAAPATTIDTATVGKGSGIVADFGKFIKGSMEYLEGTFHAMPSGTLEGKMPSMHRMRQMTGMTAGWMSGNYLGNIMAAQDLSHNPIKKEDVPSSLQWLHGALEYNAYSDEPEDRQKKVAHQLMGGAFGGLGAVAGSKSFFVTNGTTKKINTILEKAEAGGGISIMEAEHAATAIQNQFWRPFAALVGSFSAASGMALGSVLSFGTAINNVFNNDGNRKAATALFAETPLRNISNTTTKLPFGPAGTVTPFTEYLAQLNKDFYTNPESALPEATNVYLKNILVPLIGEPDEKTKEHLLTKIKAIGSAQYKQHKDAPTAANLRDAFAKQFSGAEFDNLLLDMDVDLSKVHENIGRNGLSRWMAKAADTLCLGLSGVNEAEATLKKALESSLAKKIQAAAEKAAEGGLAR